MSQMELLGRVMMLVIQSGVCPETPKHRWTKIILDAHRLGYLYVNADLTSAVLAYRIPSWDERWTTEIPAKENGDILYIAWAVSSSNNRVGLLKMLRSYLKENSVYEIIYNRHSQNDALRRFRCGQIQVA
jgi:hypothetical protein